MYVVNDLVGEHEYSTDCLSLYPIHLNQAYTGVDLFWHQHHLQMTPLFATTLAWGAEQTQSEAYSEMGEGILRATQQTMTFTQTQDMYHKLELTRLWHFYLIWITLRSEDSLIQSRVLSIS